MNESPNKSTANQSLATEICSLKRKEQNNAEALMTNRGEARQNGTTNQNQSTQK
jgi:hypothetical protein